MIPSVEERLCEIASANDVYLVEINVSFNQAEQYRYGATLMWKGFTRGNGCVIELGATISEALANAIQAMKLDRTPYTHEVAA